MMISALLSRAARLRAVNSHNRSHTSHQARTELGMTMIEIMVVVMIIGMIMGAVGFVAFNQFKKAQLKNSEAIVKTISDAVTMYMMENNGECPPDVDELHKQKIVNKKPVDAWGQKLVLKCPGEHNTDGFDLSSNGPDKQPDTEDDLTNWSSDEGEE